MLDGIISGKLKTNCEKFCLDTSFILDAWNIYYPKDIFQCFWNRPNGNIHYLWDTKEGNPTIITRFPSQASLTEFKKYTPNFDELANAKLHEYYIVESQMPGYNRDPDFKNESSRDSFLQKHNLKKLRDYQLKAIQSLQDSAKQNSTRLVFEMTIFP